MFTGCAVSIDERRHQADIEAADSFDESVEIEAKNQLAITGHCYPYSGEHIAKAIDSEFSADQVCELEDLLTDEAAKDPANHSKAYHLLRSICLNYWSTEAEDEAINTVLSRSGD